MNLFLRLENVNFLNLNPPTHWSILAWYLYPSSQFPTLSLNKMFKHLYEPIVFKHAWLLASHWASPVSHSLMSSHPFVSMLFTKPKAHLCEWKSTLWSDWHLFLVVSGQRMNEACWNWTFILWNKFKRRFYRNDKLMYLNLLWNRLVWVLRYFVINHVCFLNTCYIVFQ